MSLDRVMLKFEKSGLTLNYYKCVTGATGMTYMGEVLTGEGLQVSDKRVQSLFKDTKSFCHSLSGNILSSLHTRAIKERYT